ncbi:2746_t:CDS:2, partial [Cetraspora pellucida]
METITQNEPINKQENSTLERNKISSFSRITELPEQESYAGSSANKEENSYLQDDASITDDVSLQENDLIQDEQKEPLLPSIEIDNDKRNSISSKDKDLLSDLVSAPHDELTALYLNTEPQAGNKNTKETSPIIE